MLDNFGTIDGSEEYIDRLNRMFKAWKCQRYIRVYSDDEEYCNRIELIIEHHFRKMNALNPLKMCFDCYAFVTRDMQKKYNHKKVIDFEQFLDMYFCLGESSNLKGISDKRKLSTGSYWCLPGFTTKPCVAAKDEPDTKLAKRTDLIVQATEEDLVPKVLKRYCDALENMHLQRLKKGIGKENLGDLDINISNKLNEIEDYIKIQIQCLEGMKDKFVLKDISNTNN